MNRLDVEEIFPLLPVQRELLVQSALNAGRGIGVVQLVFELDGTDDLRPLREAFERISNERAVLRTVFVRLDSDKPRQVTMKRLPVPWEELDWRERDDVERAFNDLVQREKLRDFTAGKAMYRVVAAQGSDRWRVVLTYHHAMMDGWSLGVLLEDVMSAYGREGTSRDVRSGEFVDFVEWRLKRSRDSAAEFWKRLLGDAELPTPLPLRRRGSSRDATGRDRRRRALGSALMGALRDAARRHRVTVGTLVHATWAVVLSLYSGESDVTFVSVDSGRDCPVRDAATLMGCLVNTHPIRIALDRERDVGDWLRDVQGALTQARSSAGPSMAEVKKLLGLRGSDVLAESLVAMVNYPLDAAGRTELAPGVGISNTRMSEETGFPLTLRFWDDADGQVDLAFETANFDGEDIDELCLRYIELLRRLAFAETVSDLFGLDEGERASVVRSLRGHELKVPGGGLHQPIEQHAVEYPDSVALRCGDDEVTRGTLDSWANGLAWELEKRGVRPGAHVGIALPRGPAMVAAVLAVLKAGAAYVPFDLAYPAARNKQIFEDARPCVVIGSSDDVGRICDAPCVLPEVEARAEPPMLADSIDADALAYLIYTSGTTGRPKGVMIRHRNVTARIEWARAEFGAESKIATLFSTSLCFDLSVFEIFCTLALGGEIVIAQNVLALPELAKKHRVSLVNSTPSAYAALLAVESLPTCVDTVLCAGEPLSGSLVDRLYSSPNVKRVYNLYGPSEDTTYSTGGVIPPNTERPGIGRSLPGTRAYVLDEGRQLVPNGAIGTLYLAGAGLSGGYLARPELSGSRFVDDPFEQGSSLMYCTGDLVRARKDGLLEFVGRRDGQVKIRGYRVELSEVQRVLENLGGVRTAAVTMRSDNRGPYVCAYVVGEEVSESRIRASMREQLPEAFVPARVVALDEIPTTVNGKLDRSRLPAPTQVKVGEKPTNQDERRVAEVWGELLGQPASSLGRDDNFFDVGGDSLMLVQLKDRLKRAFMRDFPIVELFRYTSVRAQARWLGSTETSSEGLSSATRRAEDRRQRMRSRGGRRRR